MLAMIVRQSFTSLSVDLLGLINTPQLSPIELLPHLKRLRTHSRSQFETQFKKYHFLVTNTLTKETIASLEGYHQPKRLTSPQTKLKGQTDKRQRQSFTIASKTKAIPINKEASYLLLDALTNLHQHHQGKLASGGLLKVYNRLANQLLKGYDFRKCSETAKRSRQILSEDSKDNLWTVNDSNLEQAISRNIAVCYLTARYNPKLTASLYLAMQPYLRPFLPKINAQQALQIIILSNKANIVSANTLDTMLQFVYPSLGELNSAQLVQLLNALAQSHKYVNKHVVNRLCQQIRQLAVRPNTSNSILLKCLSSISLIQRNMDSPQVYLEKLTPLYSALLPYFGRITSQLSTSHLKAVANAARRSRYLSETLLYGLIRECLVRQLDGLAVGGKKEANKLQDKNTNPSNNLLNSNQSDATQISLPNKTISLQVLCIVLHCLATFNFHHSGFKDYFLGIMRLAKTTIEDKRYQKVGYQQKNSQNNSDYDKSIPNSKHLPRHPLQLPTYLIHRVLWSICVLYPRQVVAELGQLLTQTHQQETQNELERQKTMNQNDKESLLNKPKPSTISDAQLSVRYYAYLFTKSIDPSLTNGRWGWTKTNNKIQPQLQIQQSNPYNYASVPQLAIYQTLLELGYPTILEHSIFGLECDLYLPTIPLVIEVNGRQHWVRGVEKGVNKELSELSQNPQNLQQPSTLTKYPLGSTVLKKRIIEQIEHIKYVNITVQQCQLWQSNQILKPKIDQIIRGAIADKQKQDSKQHESI